MCIVTPAFGPMELSRDSNPELFDLARCGLGALGVVTQLTLQCVPAQRLAEETFVASPAEVERNHHKCGAGGWVRGG